ncbi:MAG: NAD(P)-dependent dehydrogenase (short-subunit alcohol dehydrogenase family) [Halieaceae bacterium]|jgi:NAD(P)-dependent dehydrogenase (short-subunit alcohol dehydrogenase family)
MSFIYRAILHFVVLLTVFSASLATAEPSGTVLITGANRGIGFALAAEFYNNGWQVIGTTRKLEKASSLRSLGVQVEILDVSSQPSVDALSRRLQRQTIDILINNAGILGVRSDDFAALDISKLDRILDVNTLGPLRVIQALLPNLDASKNKVIANISSSFGSIEQAMGGCCLGYAVSKTGLNMANKILSTEYAEQGYIFAVLHPGPVATDIQLDGATSSALDKSIARAKIFVKQTILSSPVNRITREQSASAL